MKTSCEKFLNLAHYFPYHANQKASNAIVRAENLLINVGLYFEEAVTPYRKNVVKKKTLSHTHSGFQAEKIVHLNTDLHFYGPCTCIEAVHAGCMALLLT